MNKLYVIGNCYVNNEEDAKRLFNILITSGYTLAYDLNSKTSCTILKEEYIVSEEENKEEEK